MSDFDLKELVASLAISQKKREPLWMMNLRLKAYRSWKKMKEPHWAFLRYEPINYNKISYYAAIKKKPKSLRIFKDKIEKLVYTVFFSF